MKLNKPEDVAAALAAANARGRSWRPDNRRTRAEVTVDQIAVTSYSASGPAFRAFAVLADAVEVKAKGELLALDIARRAILQLHSESAEPADALRLAEEYNASLRVRQQYLDATAKAGATLAREMKDVAALSAALNAELDKAAP